MSFVLSLIHPSRVGHACPSLVLLLFTVCTTILADVPGLRFLRHPESAVAMPGADVTFECALNVSADRVEWRHRGRPLVGNRSQGGGGRLVVHLAEDPAQYAEQSGTYQCVAWFGASAMASLPAELQVAMLQPLPRSQFSMRPVQVVVAPGNVVPFSCPPPPSIPPAQVRFARNGNPITAWVSPGGTMLLANVTTADSGLYSCSATNSFMDKTVTLPFTFQLNVEPTSTNHAPHYTTSDHNQYQVNYTVTAGTDTKLMCPVVGWPVPSMTWSKYGGSLSPERTTMVPGALLLSSVTHADEGTYLSEASNGVGPRIKCIVMLYVQEPPKIVTEPQSMTVEEGGEVHLECAAKGHPAPVISWLQNGESVEKDSKHIIATGSRLKIKPVEKRHAGMFQCFATNSLGSAFGLAMLQVQPRPITSQPTYEEPGEYDIDARPRQGHKPKRRPNKPKTSQKAIMIPPSKPNITRLSDDSVMVRWSVTPDEEGLAIYFFKVQYRDLGINAGKSQWNTIDADIAPHIRSYEVDGLKTNHVYRFRIAAVYTNNDNKLSPSSTRFQLLKETEADTKRPLYPPNLIRANGVSPSAIEIEWEYSEVPSIPVEGFFIHYRATTMAGDYSKVTVLGENTRTFLITHLLPDNSYDIKMQTFNSAGTSDFSSIRSSRTQYMPATTESGHGGSDSPPVSEGGLNIPMSNEGGSQHLTMVVGTVLGGLALLLLLLSVGVYLCRQTVSRTAAADHDQAKEVQAYGLAAVGNPLTNGTNHHLHLHHRHLASPRVHITANPLAATDHYKSDGELEVSSQNNNCAALLEPSRRRRRLASVNDSTDEGEDEEVETPPPPLPRGHCENYV
ncbi:hypothetical protein B566_EDAN010188 [Ephemera danica]|nr:hypothetical protein B566_EDAN010188 [Ephemera danica]